MGGGEGGGGEEFFRGRAWWERVVQVLESASEFLEIPIIKLSPQLLFDLLFMCRLKDIASLVICSLMVF